VPKTVQEDQGKEIKLFTFEEISVAIDEKGNAVYEGEPLHKVKRFRVVDNEIYAAAMTSLTADLLSRLSKY
jgi:hypothetical protein